MTPVVAPPTPARAYIAERTIAAYRGGDPEKAARRFAWLVGILVLSTIVTVSIFAFVLSGPKLSKPAAEFTIVLMLTFATVTVVAGMILMSNALITFSLGRLEEIRRKSQELELAEQLVHIRDAGRTILHIYELPASQRVAALAQSEAELLRFAAESERVVPS